MCICVNPEKKQSKSKFSRRFSTSNNIAQWISINLCSGLPLIVSLLKISGIFFFQAPKFSENTSKGSSGKFCRKIKRFGSNDTQGEQSSTDTTLQAPFKISIRLAKLSIIVIILQDLLA